MLDFQKRTKKYFDLTLHDGTKLQIKPPTMEVFEAMQEVAKDPTKVGRAQVDEVLRSILQANKDNIVISLEQIQVFDFDDIMELFTGYLGFVNGILSDPNLQSLIAQQRMMRA